MEANAPAPYETPESILAACRRETDPTPEAEDRAVDRLIEGFPPDALRRALRPRLDALDDADGGVVLRLLEALLDPGLAGDLAAALGRQPNLAADRAWEALALLDGAGRLDDHPELVERWDELNDAIDPGDAANGLAEQLEEEPAGSWVALEGLGAIDPTTRVEIIASLADAPAGPGLVAFLRILTFAHDDATRAAALDALFDPARGDDHHRRAWVEVANDHFDPRVRDRARRRLAADGRSDVEVAAYIAATTDPAARPIPELVGSLVGTVDGDGIGSVVLASRDRDAWVVAAFRCDVDRGIVGIRGQVGPDPASIGDFFGQFAADEPGELIEDDPGLAVALLGGSWLASRATTNPALRFWIERTVGPAFDPRPFAGPFDPDDVVSESLALLAEPSWAILESCPTWVDRSPATFAQAEAILLRGDAPPDPRRDAGAFRYLFEHHLIGRLDHYRRLLTWMASFWDARGDADLARSALALVWQLADPQNAVPNHPFIIALATKSLAAAQADIRRGLDPRRPDRAPGIEGV